MRYLRVGGGLLIGVQVASIAVFLGLGERWPRGPASRRDTATNITTGLLLGVFRLLVTAGLVDRIGPGLVDLAALPAPVQVAVGFVALDFLRWALHVADHRVPLLWTFHRVHHSSLRLDATSGLRMHVVDLVQLAVLPVLLFSAVLRLGPGLVPWVLVPGAILDAFEHANLRIDVTSGFWRAFDLVLNNPHFHAWHHTADARHDGNYGNVLTIWDRLFGTCVSAPGTPEAFGLGPDALRDDVFGLQLLRRAP